MKKDLFDQLYYGNYSIDEILAHSEERTILLAGIVNDQTKLENKLSDEDYNLIIEITNKYNSMLSLYARSYYSEGIKFATNFLFNALSNNHSEEK